MAREGSAEAFVPPTVRAGETLLDSYTFHSSGEASTSGDERARADEAERARRARILAENAALRSTGKEKLVLGEDGDEMLYERPEERGGAGASDEDDDEVTSLQTSTDGDAWIIGIDEAGRGPVLGPQVYALAYCRKRYAQSKLAGLGFADSKTLTDDVRCELFARMLEARDEGQDAVDGEAPIKYAARIMSPHDISKGMLSRTPYNLNAQSHDATMGLIRDVLARGFNVTEVRAAKLQSLGSSAKNLRQRPEQAYVDTVGQADSYRAKLSGAFPTVNFTVTSKADSLFPIVSAASVVAKVTRDKVLDAWTFSESTFVDKHGLDDARTFGSGYPSGESFERVTL